MPPLFWCSFLSITSVSFATQHHSCSIPEICKLHWARRSTSLDTTLLWCGAVSLAVYKYLVCVGLKQLPGRSAAVDLYAKNEGRMPLEIFWSMCVLTTLLQERLAPAKWSTISFIYCFY